MFSFSKWLKEWKPIHFCWWFVKHNLPIPKYFIGTTATYDQVHWKIGDNNNSDADSCSFDALDTPRTGQAKTSPFMIRIQVAETGGGAGANVYKNLYYNSSDNAATAVLVGTALGGNIKCEPINGQPADGDNLAGSTVVFDNSGSYTWIEGEYDEGDANTDKSDIDAGEYTDYQFCVQFTANAANSTTHYFFVRNNDDALNAHTAGGAQVETVAGATQRNFADTLTLTTTTSSLILLRQNDFADTLALTTLTSDVALFRLLSFLDTLEITTLTSDPELSGLSIDFSDTLTITTTTSDPILFRLTSFLDSLDITTLTSSPKLMLVKNFIDTLSLTTLTSDVKLRLMKNFSDTLTITSNTSEETILTRVSNFANSLDLTTLTSDVALALLTNFANTIEITTSTSMVILTVEGGAIWIGPINSLIELLQPSTNITDKSLSSIIENKSVSSEIILKNQKGDIVWL